MADRKRCVRYSEEELEDMKRLYESVMSFAAHGMFFRTGKIVGKRMASNSGKAKDYFTTASSMLVDGGWVESIEFKEGEAVATGSIEGGRASGPSCHILRGIISCLYEERNGAGVTCTEVECISSGAQRCRFKIDSGGK
jgi:predicted hydrocarbon binding protein